jgi:elongation of very long chain fatty acids protein 7
MYLLCEDPRTNDWPMISSPLPGLSILALYLIFCLRVGPKMMENRKPYQLKSLLIVYNAIQVYASVWLFWEVRFCVCNLYSLLTKTLFPLVE